MVKACRSEDKHPCAPKGLLFGVTTTDLATYAMVSALLPVAALAAGWAPGAARGED